MFSFNGIGIQAFDFKPTDSAGEYHAGVWFTFLWLPIFPLYALTIKPVVENAAPRILGTVGLATGIFFTKSKFEIVARNKINWESARTIWSDIYLKGLLVAFSPLITSFIFFLALLNQVEASQQKFIGNVYFVVAAILFLWAYYILHKKYKKYEKQALDIWK